jgi:Kef-type K+ transport system membrane component KefB
MSTVGGKIAARVETIYRAVKPFVALGIVALVGYLLLPKILEYLSRPEAPQIVGMGVIVIALALIGLSRKAARKPPRPKIPETTFAQ